MPISSIGRKVKGRAGVTRNDSKATAGMRNTATCALDEIAISDASTMPPRRAITTAPPCSAALPTIATMIVAMKNSDRPAARAKPSSE